MIVVWLFIAVPWVCLQFVIVIFPDHTHLVFLINWARQWLVTFNLLKTEAVLFTLKTDFFPLLIFDNIPKNFVESHKP